MTTRSLLAGVAFACLAAPDLGAQGASVVGEVVAKDGGAPLGHSAITVADGCCH